MAQKITVICDAPTSDKHLLPEHEADGVARVGYNGQWRELDACEAGSDVIRDIMADLMSRGHTYGGQKAAAASGPKSSRGRAGGQALKLNAAIRKWAKGKNLHVAPSGRIPAEIVEAYNLDQQFHGTEVKV